ncbi:methyltransferase family protein [Balneola sp. MJW-20]|uniref:methyltransferase family protein n=1 Tax=Gracilimonas aurantiaca TaxID=3234185 RepID=UPI003466BC96
MEKINLKVPPVIVFFCSLGLIWLLQEYIPDAYQFKAERWLLVFLLTLGVCIAFAAVIQFMISSTSVDPHKPEKASSLVRNGIYRLSRNPMYLGMLIILVAAILKWGDPIALLVLPVYIGYMNKFQIKPEEQKMEEKFGKEYLNYKSEVRRWI